MHKDVCTGSSLTNKITSNIGLQYVDTTQLNTTDLQIVVLSLNSISVNPIEKVSQNW